MHFLILPLFPLLQVYPFLYQTNREAKKNLNHYVMSTGTRHYLDPLQLPFMFPSHLVLGRQPFQLGLGWIRQTNRNHDFPLSWVHQRPLILFGLVDPCTYLVVVSSFRWG